MNLNWTIAKIEEIAEVNPRLGKAGIPDDLLVSFVPMPAVGAGDGSIDVSQVRPFGEVKKGFTSFQQGDVLFAKITPCMENGKMAVVPKVENGYGFGSTEFHVLRPKPGIDARYLYYYVSSRRFRGEAEHQMTGAVGQKRVPTQYLRECTILLAPLNEQTRIIAEIEKQFSRLDEAVANLKRVKANLKRYKAAVLKAAVEGKLTEEWRRGTACRAHDVYGNSKQGTACCAPTETGAELLQRILAERRKAEGKGKYKKPVGPDTSGLPELPAGWVWASVDQLAEKITDGEHLSPNTIDAGVPLLSAKDVREFGVLFEDASFVSAEDAGRFRARCNPEVGDILIVSRGATIGRSCIVNVDRLFCLMGSVILVKAQKQISSQFLLANLKSTSSFKRLQGVSGSTAQQAIYIRDIRSLPVPLPPLTEQHQIVAEVERRLSIVAETETQVDANLRRADRLRQSILKQAFSGQLVPQNPNDEPAGVLLERIRAMHPEQPKEQAIRQRKHRPPAPKTGAPSSEPLPLVAEAPATYGDAIIARILTAMQPGREYARADLADPLGLTTGQWNAAIQKLKRVGRVRQTGDRRGARYLIVS